MNPGDGHSTAGWGALGPLPHPLPCRRSHRASTAEWPQCGLQEASLALEIPLAFHRIDSFAQKSRG